MSVEFCYCPVCQTVLDDFATGGAAVIRPRALCPKCGSLERNRYYGAVVGAMTATFASADVVLDIAPTTGMTALFRRHLAGGLHLTCDFDPAADRRKVVLQGDLTNLPLPDESVDILICMQVLEHIPDDRAAMSEIRRVLKPRGIALVNVPYRAGAVTDEDPSAPPEERTRRFGQADHVRYYGRDFNDRLSAAGLGFAQTTSLETFGDDITFRLALSGAEAFWFVWRNADDPPPTCLLDNETLRRHIEAEMSSRAPSAPSASAQELPIPSAKPSPWWRRLVARVSARDRAR